MEIKPRAFPLQKSLALLLLLGPLLLGCGGGPSTAEVSGKVQFKDGTVPQGGVCVVQFHPTVDSPAEIRKAASGSIESDGTFRVYTRKPGDGIHLGKYAVTFTVWKGQMQPISLVHQKYTKVETTPYIVDIDGDRDDLLFEIEPAN